MIYFENQCVSCDLPCIYQSCPYWSVAVAECDVCHDEDVVCRLEGEDLCEKCANKRLQEVFDTLTIEEKAKALELEIEDIDAVIDAASEN